MAHHEVVFMRDVLGQQQVAQQRHQRQRDDQRADQRTRHGVGHGREDLALVALQRKDRDVRGDDDDHREHGRAAHFGGGLQDGVHARAAVLDLGFLQLAQPLEDVLHHDHRAIHDDAEVHRAQRQQVGGNAHPGQADERGQQRQRNHDRHDGRGAHIGQEQVQHRHHQQRALDQVAEYRMQGLVDQRGAVVVGHDLHALGQDRAVQQVDPLLERFQHQRGVFALAHHHDARNDIVLVVLAHQALGRRGAGPDLGNVLDQDRRAIDLRHHHIGDIGRGTEAAQRAQQELLAPVGHGAAAGVGVGALQGGKELRERDLGVAHLRQVGVDLVLLDGAANGDKVGHARDLAQVLLHHPVLQRAQFLRAVALAGQAKAEDLADGGGQRRQLRLHAVGQVHPAQALDHLLAGHHVGGLVIEGDHQEGQAELGVREHPHGVRRAGQRGLDRDRDLALDFLGSAARVQRNDVDLDVGDIREGFDRQVLEGRKATPDEDGKAEPDEQLLVQGKMDDARNHVAVFLTASRWRCWLRSRAPR